MNYLQKFAVSETGSVNSFGVHFVLFIFDYQTSIPETPTKPASAGAFRPPHWNYFSFVSNQLLSRLLPVFVYFCNRPSLTFNMSVHRSLPVWSSFVPVIGATNAPVVSPWQNVPFSTNYKKFENISLTLIYYPFSRRSGLSAAIPIALKLRSKIQAALPCPGYCKS